MHHKTGLRHDPGETDQTIFVVGNDILKHFLVTLEIQTYVRLAWRLIFFNVIESI
jgi:hypothetical protein